MPLHYVEAPPRAFRRPALTAAALHDEVKERPMARALMGYVGNGNEQALTLEVNRLRKRVRELEAEVAELRATHTEMDLELHRMTEEVSLNPA